MVDSLLFLFGSQFKKKKKKQEEEEAERITFVVFTVEELWSIYSTWLAECELTHEARE